MNLSWAERQEEQSCLLLQLRRQQFWHLKHTHTSAHVLLYEKRTVFCRFSGQTVAYVLVSHTFPLLSFQQSLTLMLSLSSTHTRFLTPWPPGVTHYHMCVCVCLLVFVCAQLSGRDCVSTSQQTETRRVNRLHWKPLSGLRRELAISHLSFTVHGVLCSHAMSKLY